jgi:hypothetical protein
MRTTVHRGEVGLLNHSSSRLGRSGMASRNWRRKKAMTSSGVLRELKAPSGLSASSKGMKSVHLLGRGGCQHRWHSLVKCNHGDSITDPLATSATTWVVGVGGCFAWAGLTEIHLCRTRIDG